MEKESKDWDYSAELASKSRFKKFAKNHPRENQSLFKNLDMLLGFLDLGRRINTFKIGFFRSEGKGVYRIGQTNLASAKESRLFIYPDEETKIIYVLSIGTKETEKKDIVESHKIVEKFLKKAEETENEL